MALVKDQSEDSQSANPIQLAAEGLRRPTVYVLAAGQSRNIVLRAEQQLIHAIAPFGTVWRGVDARSSERWPPIASRAIQIFASSNRLLSWLRQLEALRRATLVEEPRACDLPDGAHNDLGQHCGVRDDLSCGSPACRGRLAPRPSNDFVVEDRD
jgi:hypothetical protein